LETKRKRMIVRTTPTFVSMVMTLLMMMLAIGCCLGERTTPLKAPLLPLYTRGRRIVDSSGQEVKFYCVNWSGAHMQDYVVGGLHVATIAEISNQIASLGFNCVRLQWSLEMYYNNPPVPYSAVVAMPELAGAKALDAYMLVVQTLAEYNIMTIIDNHVSDANWSFFLFFFIIISSSITKFFSFLTIIDNHVSDANW